MRNVLFILAISAGLGLAFSRKPSQGEATTSSSSSQASASSGQAKGFPNKDWNEKALELVKKSRLAGFKPRDAKSFCPNGMTDNNWVALLASMAKYESDFKPSTTYKENFKNSKGEYVISVGLLQTSYESARGYGFSDATTEKLKDPNYNLAVAVKIMEKWIVQDAVITSGASPYKGGGRYWSCLRSSGKLSSVKSYLKNLCE